MNNRNFSSFYGVFAAIAIFLTAVAVRDMWVGSDVRQPTIHKVYAGGTSGAGDDTYTNSQLQDAINACLPGDSILLQEGTTYTGRFVLRANNTAYCTIRTGVNASGTILPDSDFPTSGTRITPAYSSKLAKLQAPIANDPALMTVEPGNTGSRCSAAPCNANFWHIKWLEFTTEPAFYNGSGLVLLGSVAPNGALYDGGSNIQDQYDEQPGDIIFEQNLVTGHPIMGQHKGVVVSSKNTVIKDNYIKDIKSSTNDGQGIWLFNAALNVDILNNYVEGSTENIMSGGDDYRMRFSTTVSASPAPTTTVFTVASTANLDYTIGKWIAVFSNGALRQTKITAISGDQLTVSPALPVAPSSGAAVNWNANTRNINVRLNHFYKPPQWRDDVVTAPATGLSATPVANGSLDADTTYYYKIVSRRKMNRGQFARSAPSTELTCTTTSSARSCQINWDAVSTIESQYGGEYYVYVSTSSGTQNYRYAVNAPTVTYTDTGSVGSRYQVNNGGGYSSGATLINVDTGVGPLNVGDNVKFAGHATTYTIAAITGGTVAAPTQIQFFSPGLTAAVADNELITIPIHSTGTKFSVKNNFELKDCVNCLIEGNLIEYSWQSGQAGFLMTLTPVNQSGGDYSNTLQDVTVRYNKGSHGAGAWGFTTTDATTHISGATERLNVSNNLFTDISPTWGAMQYTWTVSAGEHSGLLTWDGVDVTVDHNTYITTTSGPMRADLYKSGALRRLVNFKYSNNIERRGTNGLRALTPGFDLEGQTSWDKFVSGTPVFAKNVIASATGSLYPNSANNFFPNETDLQAQFVSYPTGDYRIASGSTWKNAGTDGADLGANITQINTYTTIASTGNNGVPLAVTSTTLTAWTVQVFRSFQLTASGGVGPYTWSIVSGSLPLGVTMTVGGFIAGTCTTIGTTPLTVRATDSLGATDDQALFFTCDNPISAFYNWAKGALLDGTIDLLTKNLKVMVVGPTYTFDPDHLYIDTGGANDPVDARLTGTTDQTLATRVVVIDNANDRAYFIADPVTFTSVPGAQSITSVLIYDDTGNPTTSKIVARISVNHVTDGGSVLIQWPSGAVGGILRIQ
jgi:hypothetical protein